MGISHSIPRKGIEGRGVTLSGSQAVRVFIAGQQEDRRRVRIDTPCQNLLQHEVWDDAPRSAPPAQLLSNETGMMVTIYCAEFDQFIATELRLEVVTADGIAPRFFINRHLRLFLPDRDHFSTEHPPPEIVQLNAIAMSCWQFNGPPGGL